MDREFSTATLVDNTNLLIENGFNFPDKDGFKNILDRNEAILNNSFSKEDLIKTITEVNDNTSHKLRKSNSETVNFFKWSSPINSLTKIENTKEFEFRFPLNQIIEAKKRNNFKFRQFYRKWITIEDIYQNWEIFGFTILLFIGNKIYSDYSFWMDEQEILVHFKYFPALIKNNPLLTFYKFETQFQTRIKVSRNQMRKLWNYKIPLSYLNDKRILNYSNLICCVNPKSERTDGKVIEDVLSNNLEFVKVENNFIDCSSFSDKTKAIIFSERREWLDLSIFVPKNFHEFPILLPVDYINQSVPDNFKQVFTETDSKLKLVNSDNKKVFINYSQVSEYSDEWKLMIRPMVLSDAFKENQETDWSFLNFVSELRNLTIKLADEVEEFRFFIKEGISNTAFDLAFDKVVILINQVRSRFRDFLVAKKANLNLSFEKIYSSVLIPMIQDISVNRQYSTHFKNADQTKTFWFQVAEFLIIPREIADNYYNIEYIKNSKMGTAWEIPSEYRNKIRFSHPVSANDIWMFEYSFKDKCWKPAPEIQIEFKYPNVYLFSSEEKLNGRIFKAFIFYSDLMNVREEISEILEPEVNWPVDLKKYEFDKFGKFYDIFIEKFYWMALQKVYSDLLLTDYRYELVEYICQNRFYDRYNQLFLENIDPYFKISMIKYLKSDLYNFPTASAIKNFNEALEEEVNNFRNVINFEIYLNKNWKASFIQIPIKIRSSNDFAKLEFENNYDIDISYEVFINGRQITDFSVEHIDSMYDKIRIDEDKFDLIKESITIPEQVINNYKIDKIVITDPGAGYSVGQNIFVKINNNLVKFQVAELTNSHLKGIAKVSFNDISYSYNPAFINQPVLKSNFENIDDEFGSSFYDSLEYPGIIKPMTFSYNDFQFRTKRFDNLIIDDRNLNYPYPEATDNENFPINGDIDFNWYLGSRIDNHQVDKYDMHRWKGIEVLNPVTDNFISDFERFPSNYKTNYQLFEIVRFHKDLELPNADLIVNNFSELPLNTSDWEEVQVGKEVIVLNDENYNNESTKYRIRGFWKSGRIAYNYPTIVSQEKTSLEVNWNSIDSYQDLPTLSAQYLTDWESINFYREFQEKISDKKIFPKFKIIKNNSTFVKDLTIDDLTVFNWTDKIWEDLNDSSKWNLTVTENGFILNYLEQNQFSKIFKFYINKNSSVQKRNQSLVRNAKISAVSKLFETKTIPEETVSVNTGNNLLVRKIFPYLFKQQFELTFNQYEMVVNLKKYMHFKNQIHLEDIKIMNLSTGLYENILDHRKFRVDFYRPDLTENDTEEICKVDQVILNSPGRNFNDGFIWGWNDVKQIYIFGNVKCNQISGEILDFELTSVSEYPEDSMTLEFQLFQNFIQSPEEIGSVLISFKKEKIQINENNYILDIQNPQAIVPEQFRIFVKYPLNKDRIYKYEVRIEKERKEFTVSQPVSLVSPEFVIPNQDLVQSTIYILTPNGRLPLVNPSTKKPTFVVERTGDSTKIKVMIIYQANTELKIVSEPFSMRSVFTTSSVSSHGYLNLKGKLNKPLNKKYFDFWMNGKLLTDEVTILTPTKLFLHGLTSLNNFEIIENDRDPNEYFSKKFFSYSTNYMDNPCYNYNFTTYLDKALDGWFGYTNDELRLLTFPVYPQVETTSIYYPDYPINQNIDSNIYSIADASLINDPTVQFIYNLFIFGNPTINGISLNSQFLSFKKLGFLPISEQNLVNLEDQVWSNEIYSNPYFDQHIIINKNLYYGVIGKSFDSLGNETNDEDKVAFRVLSSKIIKIDDSKKRISIVE